MAARLLMTGALMSACIALDYNTVKSDIKTVLTTSQSWWPADYGNYGPLMIRLAWHCAGSYRTSDGRGGCDGGRQRFDPERSWADNTNLDKARKLLDPIKMKYGQDLSWGDLIVLAGTTAIESMGGPVLGFCGGRVDAYDGSESIQLGPSDYQQAIAPCVVNGTCKAPLGATTVGLIYVNPEGPMGIPDANGSRFDIRDTFGRMAMNDSETVALIGGGHAFGKAHGACPESPGSPPSDDPLHPWPGNCGTGVGKGLGMNQVTSGFEGPWTTSPTAWSNAYFQILKQFSFEVHIGPGGHNQWKVNGTSPVAPPAHGNESQAVMMLTSDVSLLLDEEYSKLVTHFAADKDALSHAFTHAWYKLMSRDMGPHERCKGALVPPAQPFQYPMPSPPAEIADANAVKDKIRTALRTGSIELIADKENDKAYYGAWFVHLAYQCASTFRQTDWLGGCNGARIRFSPEKEWQENEAMDKVLTLLQPIKNEFGSKLSWADLIVLAGTVALEDASGTTMDFCAGRSDAEDGLGSEYLAPRSFTDPALTLSEQRKLFWMSEREMVALQGRLRSVVQLEMKGFNGSYTTDPSELSNNYFKILLNNDWVKDSKVGQYKSVNGSLYMLDSDLVIKADSTLAAIAQEFAGNNTLFLEEFKSAWTKLLNADRYDGKCMSNDSDNTASDAPLSTWKVVLASVGGSLAFAVGAFCIWRYTCSGNKRREESVPLIPSNK